MIWLDGTLYPDLDQPPVALNTHAEQVDFIARLCAAWDFGVLPSMNTIREVRRPEWRAAVNDCLLLTSHSYHLLRQWHDLPAVPYLGIVPAWIRHDPCLSRV